jgi:signal transduction histidine kinase
MNGELRRLLATAVALPVVLMLASVTLLLWRLHELSVLSERAGHSDSVLVCASRMQKSVSEMQTGVGGFLLSQSDVFLESYRAGAQRLSGELALLTDLVADNDTQLATARELRREAESWAAELAGWLRDLRADEDAIEDRERVARGTFARKPREDRVRDLIGTFIERERALRSVRDEAAARATRLTFWLTAVLLSAVGAALAWFSRHQLRTVTETHAAALQRAVSSERVEREARETAQQAVRSRDNFVSLASHELKTPLTSLRLQLQTLLRHAAKEQGEISPERVTNKLNAAMRQVDRLARLVSDLMDVSRLASGQLSVDIGTVDVTELVRRVVGEFEDDVREAGCTLSLHAASEVLVRADAARLEQLVVNLLTNAMKYGKGSPIAIEVSRADTRGCVSFTDHGIGIAAEDQSRIFQRFERAEGAQSFHGVGLGLYIVRNLLDLMGGDIMVESELGRGATFRVSLPAA